MIKVKLNEWKSEHQVDETYKVLRTNLQFCGADKKVIVITSCTPDEGKSDVSFHLAVSLAESGKSVLLIDADLRKSVLPGNRLFKDMIRVVRDVYDYVIIDSPPLGVVIDSAIIADSCDGSILVIEAGAISYRYVQEVRGQLEKSNCPILGTILNKVDYKEGSMDIMGNMENMAITESIKRKRGVYLL